MTKTKMKPAHVLREEAERAQAVADELSRQARAAEQAELEAARPIEPDIPCGSNCVVVLFTKQSLTTPRGVRHYAAVGTESKTLNARLYAVSGKQRLMLWLELLDFIGKSNWHHMRVMTAVGPIKTGVPDDE